VAVCFEAPEYTADVDALGALRLLEGCGNIAILDDLTEQQGTAIAAGQIGTELDLNGAFGRHQEQEYGFIHGEQSLLVWFLSQQPDSTKSCSPPTYSPRLPVNRQG
jgi:hypothetical protein